MLIVLTTVPDLPSAERLATGIVEHRLGACVQILPPMTSVYRWRGEIHKEPEHLILIKTMSEKWNDLRHYIKANHAYAVPEIVAIKSEHASLEYLEWMRSALSPEAEG
jgi:periplasmic divalent cation tolerance protein